MKQVMNQWIAAIALLGASMMWFAGWQHQTPAAATLTDQYLPNTSSSYQLYQQPHAVWLVKDSMVGANMGRLQEVLLLAAQQKRRPELVIYLIPERDLGESSEGGFATYPDYYEENWLLKETLARFVKQTKLQPRIYLEPDALAQAINFRNIHNNDARSQKIYYDRVAALRELVKWYKQAGCHVYLDAAHGQWFSNEPAQKQLVETLEAAGYNEATGLTTNVSSRNPLTGSPGVKDALNESDYVRALKRLLPNSAKKEFITDTGRNGGLGFKNRQFYMAANGLLFDNHTKEGRWIGYWQYTQGNVLRFFPFYGPPKSIERLLNREKYTFDDSVKVLTAPMWLDPLGDVKLGHAPTDAGTVAPITRYRFIKPPDECDGSLACAPGEARQAMNQRLQQLQALQPAGARPKMPW